MERIAAVVATVFVGGLIALQPPVNSQLARYTTVLAASFINSVVATLVVGVVMLFAGGLELRGVADAPLVYLTGGLLGAALVTVSLVTVRPLGAGGVVAATVLGQLTVSALLDQAGVLGLEHRGLTPQRVTGLLLLLVGTLLVTSR